MSSVPECDNVVDRSPWLDSWARRAVDLVVAFLLAVVTAPVVAVSFAVSALVFRAQPLFLQPRVGRWGRTITVAKVRSLPDSVSTSADKYELGDVDLGQWSKWLRRTHADELPQLWSVVGGSMSLVGPRPETVALADRLPEEFAAARHSTRPGLTGAWQLSPESGRLIWEAPEYDLVYLQVASPMTDAWLVWRTVRMLAGGPPVTLADLQARNRAAR